MGFIWTGVRPPCRCRFAELSSALRMPPQPVFWNEVFESGLSSQESLGLEIRGFWSFPSAGEGEAIAGKNATYSSESRTLPSKPYYYAK